MVLSCQHSSVMLLNLINDLLDLAKKETNTFTLNKSFFNLRDIVEQTFKILEFMAQ
jgi:signal transduction histidine kinase